MSYVDAITISITTGGGCVIHNADDNKDGKEKSLNLWFRNKDDAGYADLKVTYESDQAGMYLTEIGTVQGQNSYQFNVIDKNALGHIRFENLFLDGWDPNKLDPNKVSQKLSSTVTRASGHGGQFIRLYIDTKFWFISETRRINENNGFVKYYRFEPGKTLEGFDVMKDTKETIYLSGLQG